jgi:dihydropteroate synthase
VSISVEEELRRITPVVHLLLEKFPGIILSIDTQSSLVANETLKAGAHIINDVSGGEADKAMYDVVAKYQVPYILMHKQGSPETMQENPVYDDVVLEVLDSIVKRLGVLRSMGVNDVIIDPGFGFGKNVDQNFTLLQQLELFHLTGCPLLVGFSRKSMINRILKTKPETALNGTTVLNTIALQKGAHILRVHDAKEAHEAILLVDALKKVR